MANHARGKDFQKLRNAHEFNHQDPESDHAPDSSDDDKPVQRLLNKPDSSDDYKPIGCLLKKSRMTKDSQQNQVHSASNQRWSERSKTARKELAMKAGETIAKKNTR